MSLIVAARFTTFAEAEIAAQALFDNGFDDANVSIFFVNPPGMHHSLPAGGDEYADRAARSSHAAVIAGAGAGAVVGIAIGAGLVAALDLQPVVAAIAGGIGAYGGSLIGALNGMRSTPQRRDRGAAMDTRPSGVLLAVHVELGTEIFASNLLKNHGGKDVERASGRWRDGKWTDFDPVVPPVLSDKVAPSRA
jgi:hypothetical protein